jgi:hypothetical protein
MFFKVTYCFKHSSWYSSLLFKLLHEILFCFIQAERCVYNYSFRFPWKNILPVWLHLTWSPLSIWIICMFRKCSAQSISVTCRELDPCSLNIELQTWEWRQHVSSKRWLVPLYKSVWFHSPEDQHGHLHLFVNLKYNFDRPDFARSLFPFRIKILHAFVLFSRPPVPPSCSVCFPLKGK